MWVVVNDDFTLKIPYHLRKTDSPYAVDKYIKQGWYPVEYTKGDMFQAYVIKGKLVTLADDVPIPTDKVRVTQIVTEA